MAVKERWQSEMRERDTHKKRDRQTKKGDRDREEMKRGERRSIEEWKNIVYMYNSPHISISSYATKP